MPHGTPDWGLTSGLATTYRWADLDELAVRLGSPVSVDRRGDVVFFDDFEHGLDKWSSGSSGAGAAHYLNTGGARSGYFSVRLIAGSDADRLCSLQAPRPIASLSPTGFEYSFSWDGGSEYIGNFIVFYTGSELLGFNARYNALLHTVEVKDSLLGYQPLGTSVFPYTDPLVFHPFKLVVDPITRHFVRVILGASQYDASAFSGEVTPDPTAPNVVLFAIHQGRAGFNDQILVDDVILTQNEPS
jgi:hypothetical protein